MACHVGRVEGGALITVDWPFNERPGDVAKTAVLSGRPQMNDTRRAIIASAAGVSLPINASAVGVSFSIIASAVGVVFSIIASGVAVPPQAVSTIIVKSIRLKSVVQFSWFSFFELLCAAQRCEPKLLSFKAHIFMQEAVDVDGNNTVLQKPCQILTKV